MALTKISGDILDSGVNVAGIVTATSFDGPFIAGAGNSGILAGIITATELDLNGNVDISGNLTVHGDQTTLNTTLREVELLRVDANSSETAGIITQTNSGDILKLYDGSTEVFSVADGGALTITGTGNIINDPSTDFGLSILNNSTSAFSTSEHIEGTTNRKITPLMIRNAGATANAETYLGFDAGNTSKAQWNIGIKKTGALQGDFIFNTRTGSSTSAERLRITSDGYLVLKKEGSVGIHKNDTDGVLYIAGGNNTDVGGNINLFGSGHSELANHVRIRNSGTVALEIDENGNVGIKSTLPSYSLDLGRASSTIRLVSENTGTAIRIGAGGGSNDVTLIRVDGSTASHDGGSDDSANGFSFKYMGSGDGNNNRFTVLSDNQSGSQIKAITVLQDGKVGVGTDDPSNYGNAVKLAVYNDSHTGLTVAAGTTASDSNIFFADGVSGDATYRGNIKYAHDGDTMRFHTAATEHVRITSDGKVKIGHVNNENPTEMLHVVAKVVNQDIARFTGANRDRGLVVSTAISGATNDAVIKYNADSQNNVGQHVFLTDGNEKLRITEAGITVTGEVAASQDYPNFRPTVDFNFAAEKKLDSRITYQRTGPASFTDEFGKVVLVGDNVPRFDYDPTTRECKGLLIEESRTNFVRNSLGLGSEWVAGGGSFAVDNTITNPDGSVGAYHHTGSELYHQNIDLSGASTNTVIVSLWMKERSGQSGVMDIQIYQQITGSVIVIGAFSFDPATAVISTPGSNFSNGTVEEYPNGWYRISAKVTTSSGNFSSSTRYDIQGAEHYVWGFQMEVGEFLTSFIPTHGSVATRGEDVVRIMDDDFTDIFGTEFKNFSVVADFDNSISFDSNNASILEWWSDNNNYEDRIQIMKDNSSPYHIETRAFGNNAAIFSNGNLSASSKAATNRLATSWSVDYSTSNAANRRWAFSFSGEAVDVVGDNTGTTVPALTRFGIGCSPYKLDLTRGVLLFKRLMVYNQTLSDNQLRTLSAR